MGLSSWMKKLGASQDIAEEGFGPIHEPSDLDAILARSGDGPVFVYKHSPICGTSSFAYRQIARFIESAENKPVFYLVDVLGARAASNAVATRLEISHQSPQLILIRDGAAVWHASHGGIHAEAIEHALAAKN